MESLSYVVALKRTSSVVEEEEEGGRSKIVTCSTMHYVYMHLIYGVQHCKLCSFWRSEGSV